VISSGSSHFLEKPWTPKFLLMFQQKSFAKKGQFCKHPSFLRRVYFERSGSPTTMLLYPMVRPAHPARPGGSSMT